MTTLLKLGKHYSSDFISTNTDLSNRKKYSLDLVLDERIGAARLTEAPPNNEMWGKYWYRSDINEGMVKQLKNVAEEIASRVKHIKGDIWLDIACNTGIMFDFIPNTYYKVGIDPADDTFLKESSKRADCVVQDYFSLRAYEKAGLRDRKAKVVTTIAMFYDLSDPDSFIKDVYSILDDDGVWVIQMSYTPLMIKQIAVDNVSMEHWYYHSLNSIKKLMEPNGFKITDVSLNDANGGSARIYIQKNIAKHDSFANQPIRDCCDVRVESLLSWEANVCNISDPAIWAEFQKNVDDLKNTVVEFIKSAKADGKTVFALGASTKGNTLLQYFGLDNTLIDFISERSPAKFGLRTIGTNIPIVSEEEARSRKPDYMLVLPWHFVSEITAREDDYLSNGGKLIVPCPKFTIISK